MSKKKPEFERRDLGAGVSVMGRPQDLADPEVEAVLRKIVSVIRANAPKIQAARRRARRAQHN